MICISSFFLSLLFFVFICSPLCVVVVVVFCCSSSNSSIETGAKRTVYERGRHRCSELNQFLACAQLHVAKHLLHFLRINYERTNDHVDWLFIAFHSFRSANVSLIVFVHAFLFIFCESCDDCQWSKFVDKYKIRYLVHSFIHYIAGARSDVTACNFGETKFQKNERKKSK